MRSATRSVRAGADVEPRLARPDEGQQGVQHRIVGPGRVGTEERADRGVEVGAVGDLAESLDLLAVGADAAAQDASIARARSAGVSMSGLAPSTAISLTSSGCASRTGPRPRSPVASPTRSKAAAGRGPGSGRVVGVDRHDDRPATLRRCLDQRPDDRRRNERLVAERDEHRPGVRPIASKPTRSELDRPRSGSGLTTRRASPPVDRRLDLLRVLPSTTTDSPTPASASASRTCWRTGRPAIVASSLPPPNRDPGPGGEHESHGLLGHIGIFPPPCGQSSLATSRPTTPGAGRRCEGGRHR